MRPNRLHEALNLAAEQWYILYALVVERSESCLVPALPDMASLR